MHLITSSVVLLCSSEGGPCLIKKHKETYYSLGSTTGMIRSFKYAVGRCRSTSGALSIMSNESTIRFDLATSFLGIRE